jgi:hypothetical protein
MSMIVEDSIIAGAVPALLNSRLAKRILPRHANPQPSFTKFGIWQEIDFGSFQRDLKLRAKIFFQK